jgi:hypothetical protein
MSELSTIEPTEEQIAKHTGSNNVRKKPTIKFNDRSYKSWVDNGFDAEVFPSFDFSREVMLKFLGKADLRQGPLKQLIRMMGRIKSFDYDDNGETIGNTKKEYLFYEIRYEARDWMGGKVASPQVIEGRYQQQVLSMQTGFDPKTGKATGHYVKGDPVTRYYVPFSKAAVDKVLKDHDNFDRRYEIQYYGLFDSEHGGMKFRNGNYTYEQFVNSEFEHTRYLGNSLGGPQGNAPMGKVDPGRVQTKCSCSSCKGQEAKHSNHVQ